MKGRLYFIVAIAGLFFISSMLKGQDIQDTDLTQYVDPFIGTQGDGNTFPGATYPFGMVKLGPDCDTLSTNMGYKSDGKIRGFSHLHLSGTGGGPRYGNILVYPFGGDVLISGYGSDRGKETAKVGYFSVELPESGILAKLTCTPRTGIHRYTFNTAGRNSILIDAGSWSDFFYESHSWEYSLYVPHDVNQLINKSGGRDTFLKRLDTFFSHNYYNISNEPGFHTPCLYIYAGRHDKTVELVHSLLKKYFTEKPDGIPGNDDSGAMSSWYVFHKMGIFPNAGQDIYLITAPHFRTVTISPDGVTKLKIVAENLSAANIYIRSAELNGKPWNKAWFRHSDIKDGGTLKLVMGDKPSGWGFAELPPSRSEMKNLK
jgi:putative alpha-1,2-mannosidase